MKYISKIASAIILGILGAGSANAIPADPTLRSFTQPDGSEVSLRKVGDEYFHCYLTPEGKPVRMDAAGYYRYVDADGQPTGNIVGRGNATATEYSELRAMMLEKSPRTPYRQRLRDNLFSRTNPLAFDSEFDNNDCHDIRAVPTKGKRKVLVILVEYADQTFSTPNPEKAFHDMLNKEGYSYNGATGSARDYYLRSSFGQYQPDFDVYGPVRLSKEMAYYGANNEYDNDIRPGEIVREACNLLDPKIDFAQYDTSGDGKVDNVYIFYPQVGEAAGGPKESIWPHAWELTEMGINLTLDGVKISRYAMSDELTYRGTLVGIGTFCHEFAHVLGLPDLYDTTYGGALDPGTYSIEAKGSYNNESRTPPIFSAYERYALEWIKPYELPANATVEMLPSVDYPVMYKISTNVATDYFLIENRQPLDWDAYTPGYGMLVWHIDYDKDYWEYNKVNTEPDHQRIDIVEADPTATTSSLARFTYPGNAEVFSLTSDQSKAPTLQNFQGNNPHVRLTDIHVKPDGTLSFHAESQQKGSFERPKSPKVSIENIETTSFTINWQPENGMEYYATVMTPDTYRGNNIEFCAPLTYIGKKIGNSGKFVFSGLQEGVPYTLWLRAVDANGGISEPTTVVVPTYPVHPKEVWRGHINSPKVDNESTVLTWASSSNHNAPYELTIGKYTSDEIVDTKSNDFSNMKLSGWRLLSAKSNNTIFGAAAPSLEFTETGGMCSTPTFDAPVLKLSFWAAHPGEGLAMLDILGLDATRRVVSHTTVDKFSTKGSTIDIEMPDNVCSIKMNYRHTGSPLYIDDINVTLGKRVYTPVEGYDALTVNGNEISVSGLDKDTEYCAYIRPAGCEERSNTVKFKAVPSSIESITADNVGKLNFRVVNGILELTSEETSYAVYTADGCCLTTGHIGSFELPAPGVYIIRSGRSSAKVVY